MSESCLEWLYAGSHAGENWLSYLYLFEGAISYGYHVSAPNHRELRQDGQLGKTLCLLIKLCDWPDEPYLGYF